MYKGENMKIDYIIVQAGGKGTRLEHLTANKPKALVPVENLPMLFHLFRKFPDKRFIIIGDYKKEVLREYLACFADVKYQVVDAEGTGTCSGIQQAIQRIPDQEPFMLIWSDLILPESFQLPEQKGDYIGISQTFPCRWRYRNGIFEEERSEEYGVAGLFIFQDKSALANVPQSGELVRWMKEQGLTYRELGLAGTKEFGLLAEYEKLGQEKCRPFNKITVSGDVLTKEGIDAQGKQLAVRENRWYEMAQAKGVKNIPKIYGVNPLKMERIQGRNIYEYDFPYAEKKQILAQLVDALRGIHQLDKIPADSFSIEEAYFNKTMDRLAKIRDLIPFADQKTITVNGRECRNVFFYKRDLAKKLERIQCREFTFIHGDCTFSNLMLKNDQEPVLIDPRGYFGFTELYGDPMYDWAKLYYSIKGNYDRFNLKEFRLSIGEQDIQLEIASNGWEDMETDFYELTGAEPEIIRLLHAVIWLSLTTYAWQDYDSICGAFYNGIYYLEEVL
ncbi:phosphotransferase [Brevibacillus fulvus]|uniref:GTP:adenosylcobinamide-phosphate guanylyltransferase/thiamine kinase-like enzyme n=1 Tax=Brevibacillus fulvus TaxID=1125967 RepID=A0A939BRG6_9BACL|nr:phosphotransferase [Brevibacillus fulvus]MBM7589592.1 GTP:adenosylcobinamide-phosphate guanylyltransferase/thiamine kinase-like enzyme [Brevibacillus fulvus]